MTKPHLWPWIELFSSEGQEPRQLCVIHKQPFITNNPLNVIFSLYAESYQFSLPSLLFTTFTIMQALSSIIWAIVV